MSLAEAIEPLLEVFDDHDAFSGREVERFRFQRVLDADTFLAEQWTYPGPTTTTATPSSDR